MQDPTEDTEWNDILRSKGIIPPKEKEISENDIVDIVESTISQKSNVEKKLEDLSLDELDDLEDEEDELVLLKYRNQRIAELKALAEKSKYGNVVEISAIDYVEQVNKAGPDVYVVLHLYKQGIPLCSLINHHLNELAQKFRATKFLKSISTNCIRNYPDKNLPTVFVYNNGNMVEQFIGPAAFRESLTVEELEWMLGQTGAIETDIKENPRPKVKDILFSQLNADSNDW
ncbi:hypothetical protein V9T40_003086 [Parthenolecanium corni]|uniref:Phosducin domain-containing protein n=1 Tax=Parthenolecanium corni TaxID=536013 RepID=A0AAN9TSH9_9HEMI